MSILFVHISRVSRLLSWVIGTTPENASPLRSSNNVAHLRTDAAACVAVVSWNVVNKLQGLKQLNLVPADIVAVSLDGRRPQPTVDYDASAVAAAYFRTSPGVLPPSATPSAEQWSVINATERGANVLCRAVAGAGKTTTLLLCAGRYPAKSYLLLTYNKRLQLEVEKRALPNVKVLTYHAAAGKSYGSVIRNDEQFRGCVAAPPEYPLRFDTLMVDEAQDMSIIFFVFVRHLLRANPAATVVVVGDELQAINEYRGAHPGFLTEAANLYESSHPWVSCRLGVSHRLTPATATFINEHMYRAPVLVGGNSRDENIRPRFITAANIGATTKVLREAVHTAVFEYGADGVFVLAASVRNLNTKITPLAQLVRKHLIGIPTYVAGNDDERVNDDLIRGKLAILTFNAVKGCERPCVIVVGLDELHFEYFDRDWTDTNRIPNVLTVAATRAIKQLIVIADAKRTLRTINNSCLSAHATVIGTVGAAVARKPKADKKRTISVTSFVRHIHPDTVQTALALLISSSAGDTQIRYCPPFQPYVKFDTLTEDLRFVYGILAPVLAEVARTSETQFGFKAPRIVENEHAIELYHNTITRADYDAYPSEFWDHLAQAYNVNPESRSPTQWVILALARHAFDEGRHHIARQVTNYDWINSAALDAMRDIVMIILAGINGTFEVPMPRVKVGLNTIVGIADFVTEDDGIVWEFKLGELCEEHELQLGCYLALRGGGEGVLVSILNRERRHITLSADDAMRYLEIINADEREASVSVFDIVATYDATGGIVMMDDDPQEDEVAATCDDVYE